MSPTLHPPARDCLPLKPGDVVWLADGFGNTWTGGIVTALRPEGVYVRWPDGVVGIFAYRHVQHLKLVLKETAA